MANDKIKKINPSGDVTTLAGSGVIGNKDGTGAEATFNSPEGICIDGNGNLFVTEYSNNDVRMISPSGEVTTVVSAAAGGFSNPSGICIDASGNLYVMDRSNFQVKKLTRQ